MASRLPTTCKPLHYDLVVRTDLELDRPRFDGFVKITLKVLETTSTIVLSAAPSLTVGLASVVSTAIEHEAEQYDAYRSYDTSLERITFHFAHFLEAGSTIIFTLGFNGFLLPAMDGYYFSTCIIDGKPVHYSSTSFAPISARKCFPCFDEPALKSTFSINIISRPHLVNLSNMPVKFEGSLPNAISSELGITDSESWKITSFDKSPLMSAYLVAWGSGPFKYLESSYKSPISGQTRPLRVYAEPGIIKLAQHALDVTKEVIPTYEKMFDVEFPLPKLDLLLIREAEGGMENWGLIIGSASFYTTLPEGRDIGKLRKIASMASHEVAHQWFGNITTMKWWDSLYLNEGFATWAGDFALHKVLPEYRMDTQFVGHVLEMALSLDAKQSTHAVEVDIPDESRIIQVFDAVSYQKAASVLRMLVAHIGIDTFLNGVSLYLKRHLYANAESADLWMALSETSGIDVADLLKEWISKPGFPVIKVAKVEGGVKATQSRFRERPPLVDVEHDDETTWKVPLAVVTRNKHGTSYIDKSVVLRGQQTVIHLDTTVPFKLNAGTSGFYRVLYSSDLFHDVVAEARSATSIFSTEDRIGLFLDTMAFAKAGLMKTSAALTLVDALQETDDYFVLDNIAAAIQSMLLLWRKDAKVVVGLKLLLQAIFMPHVKRLGFDPRQEEAPFDDLLRQLAISQVAAAGEPSVVSELIKRFEQVQMNGSNKDTSPALLNTTYSTVIRFGGPRMFDAVYSTYVNSQDANVRIRCLSALSASPDENAIKQLLEWVLRDSTNRELLVLWTPLAANGRASLLVEFFIEHVGQLIQEAPMMLKYYVVQAFSSLNTNSDYDATVARFKGKDTSLYNLGLNEALDQILANVEWLKRSTGDVEEWIEQRNEKHL